MQRITCCVSAHMFALVVLFLTEAQADTFRMLIVYTQAAQDNGMGIYRAKMYGETIANRIYDNSAASLYEMPRVELAGAFKVNYTGSLTEPALEDLRKSSDANMNEVHALRNLYSADVVALVHEFTDAGGRGYLAASSDYAFQVTDHSFMITKRTLSHENGHIFGCGHNVEYSSEGYVFGHGYIGQLPGAVWGDNMAVVSADDRQEWYSNPNEWHELERRGTFPSYAYMGGVMQELPSANCALVHHGRKGTIAGFRDTPVSLDYSGQTIRTGEYAYPIAGIITVGSVSNPTTLELQSEGYFKAENSVEIRHFSTNGKLTMEAPSVTLAGTYHDNSITAVAATTQVALTNENGADTDLYGILTVEAPNIHNVGLSKSLFLASGSETSLMASSSTVFHPPLLSQGKLTATGATVVLAPGIELAQASETLLSASGSISIGGVDLDGYLEATAPTIHFEATSLGPNSNTKLHASNPISLNSGLSLAAGGKIHIKVGGGVPLAKAALQATDHAQDIGVAEPVAASRSVFASRIVYNQGRTILEYTLPDVNDVVIRIVDVRGKTAVALRLGRKPDGKHSYIVPEVLNKGVVYMIQLSAGGKSHTHRFIKGL